MRHYALGAAVWVLGVLTMTAWGTFLYVPLEQVIEQRPLIVAGKLEDIRDGRDERGDNIELAAIRIDKVLKNDLNDPAAKPGGSVEWVMDDRRNSNAIRFNRGTRGVWMLWPEGKRYVIRYPSAYQPVEKEDEVARIIEAEKKEQDAVRDGVMAELKKQEDQTSAVPAYTAAQFEKDLGKIPAAEVDVNQLRAMYVQDEQASHGWVYLDRGGKVQLATRFYACGDFSEGLTVVGTRLGKGSTIIEYGFMDRTGRLAFTDTFDSPGAFQDGRALVTKNGKSAFIDRTGKILLQLPFNSVSFGGNVGVAWKEPGTDWAGVINRDGKVLFEGPQRDIGMPAEGLVSVNSFANGQWRRGYLDAQGKMALDLASLDLTRLEPFHDGLAAVQAAGTNWGFINREGKLVVPPQFASVNEFVDGLAPVLQPRPAGSGTPGEWGYVDVDGKVAIPIKFLQAEPFSEGLAAVEVPSWVRAPWSPTAIYREYRWAFINTKGEIAIAGRFSNTQGFRHGLARVAEIDGKSYRFGMIDSSGRYVWHMRMRLR